jgi:hypothetical protein
VLVSRGSPGSVGAIRIGPSSFPAENTVMDMGQEFSNTAIERNTGISILFLNSKEAL